VYVKSALAAQLPQRWSEILQWIADGEEVQVIEFDRVIARVLPPVNVQTPDFVGRAKAIWGEAPEGRPLSALVSQ
jgi:antitoxin (DNA-binding transcriptional repressor) of toxin-antitoxin stability system